MSDDRPSLTGPVVLNAPEVGRGGGVFDTQAPSESIGRDYSDKTRHIGGLNGRNGI